MHNEPSSDAALTASACDVRAAGVARENGEQLIDTAMSVNAMIARHPATVAVFYRYGIDTCCGGVVGVAEAAHRDGIPLDELVAELRRALVEA